MKELLEILNDLRPDVDFTTAEGIVSDHIIDSIDISSMIAEIEDTFDIEIDMEYMTNENFDTVEALWAMIQELQE
ncbi:MAG: phosphopantetheine-binding protein [Clostridiales bacterium]|nr:phosphopantetheine-binding protein [Clostridiales bacterium]